jgi:hypothetical protein
MNSFERTSYRTALVAIALLGCMSGAEARCSGTRHFAPPCFTGPGGPESIDLRQCELGRVPRITVRPYSNDRNFRIRVDVTASNRQQFEVLVRIEGRGGRNQLCAPAGYSWRAE